MYYLWYLWKAYSNTFIIAEMNYYLLLPLHIIIYIYGQSSFGDTSVSLLIEKKSTCYKQLKCSAIQRQVYTNQVQTWMTVKRNIPLVYTILLSIPIYNTTLHIRYYEKQSNILNIGEIFHQVGSILFQTNFLITQPAMFYFLLRFDHIRWPSSRTECSVVTAR